MAPFFTIASFPSATRAWRADGRNPNPPSSSADSLRNARAAKREGEAAAVWPPGYRLALG